MKTTRNSPRARAERSVAKRLLRARRTIQRDIRCLTTWGRNLSQICDIADLAWIRLGALQLPQHFQHQPRFITRLGWRTWNY